MKTTKLFLAAGLWLAANVSGWSDTFYHFASLGFTVNEHDGTAVITIVRTGDTNEYTEVYIFTSDGTARANQDYTAVEGNLGFEPGATNATFTIPILNDASRESNETVVVTFIDDPHGLFVGAVLTIVDDDRGVEFSAATYSVNERDGFATITVRRQGEFTGAFTVDYWTSNGAATAAADYVAQSGTLSFAAGETNQTITITIVNDARREGDEHFWISLSNATGGAWLGFVTNAAVMIHDNDRGVEFGSTTYSVNEWDGFATITVVRGSESMGTVAVDYVATNDSARAGADFIAQSGTLSFASGETNKTFTVPILNDYLGEGDETVALTLSNVTGDTDLGEVSYAVLTIHDDEAGSSPSLDEWVKRSPLPTGNGLQSVAFGNNVFVAVGAEGTIATSCDGALWSEQNSGTAGWLFGVTWGGGKFVAVGSTGTILNSPDGTNWVQADNVSRDLNSVAYGNGMFVAVGGDGPILTSLDAIHWVPQPAGGHYLLAVAYGNGRFVATSFDGLVTSADGVTWTQVGPQRSLLGITYGNQTFVAVGDALIVTSPDGVQWTEIPQTISTYLTHMAYGNGRFIGVGLSSNAPISAISTDAVSWTLFPTDLPFSLSAIAFGHGAFAGVGGYGFIATTVDGETWVQRGRHFTVQPLNGITYADGLFVAVGGETRYSSGGQLADSPKVKSKAIGDPPGYDPNATILTSRDGVTWTPRSSGNHLLDVTWGNGSFVAVGGYSGCGRLRTNRFCFDDPEIVASSDGMTWTRSVTPIPSTTLRGVAYGDGKFIAVGQNILSSTDGLNWAFVLSNAPVSLNDITYAAGQFVAVGQGILTSSHGTNWNLTETNVILHSITFGHGLFVAVGYGVILTSPDAVVWTHRDDDRFTNLLSSSVTFYAGTFVATVAAYTFPPWELVLKTLSSPDGITWTIRSSTAYGTSVAGGNGTFVTVGSGGTIWQSGFRARPGFRTPAVRRLTDGAMHLLVEVEPPGAVVTLEASSDLSTWLPLVTLTNLNGTVEFNDSDALNHRRRFYRAALLP